MDTNYIDDIPQSVAHADKPKLNRYRAFKRDLAKLAHQLTQTSMQIRLTSTEAQLIVDVLREYATPEREALAKRILEASHRDNDDAPVSINEFLARARAQSIGY